MALARLFIFWTTPSVYKAEKSTAEVVASIELLINTSIELNAVLIAGLIASTINPALDSVPSMLVCKLLTVLSKEFPPVKLVNAQTLLSKILVQVDNVNQNNPENSNRFLGCTGFSFPGVLLSNTFHAAT